MSSKSIGKLALLCVVALLELALLGRSPLSGTYAQAKGTNVKCGDVLDAEFTTGSYESQVFLIEMSAGDRLFITGKAVGDHLKFAISIEGPTNDLIGDTAAYAAPSLDSGILSARGIYGIVAYTYNPGAYTLFIGCTLRDGAEIKPGDKKPDPAKQPGNASAPAFSGVGFPGLPTVDFSTVAKIPLPVDTTITAVITPTGGEILGYIFKAKTGDKVKLNYKRLSGNLNLDLVVLSADNKVVFQVSLVASDTFTTTLTFPATGEYTIGVFRVDLMPPDKPEPTAFQIDVSPNP